MSDPNDFQPSTPNEVQRLHHVAMDARAEDRYADQEDALQRASDLVQQDEKMPLRVKVRYWLADAQRMQRKYEAAITHYDWLIGCTLNYDSWKLTDNGSLYYLAAAFIYFVECVRLLGKLSLEELRGKISEDLLMKITVDNPQDKLEEGIRWLEQHIKKPRWAAGLYLQWGLLLRSQNKLEEAREKLHKALDLARECPDAPGYTFATYKLELADLFCDMNFQEGALQLAKEVLESAASMTNDRERAYKISFYAQLEQGNMAAARIPSLKDQSSAATLKATGARDIQILQRLQSIDEKLGGITAGLYQTTSALAAPEQQSTIQEISAGKLEQAERTRISEYKEFNQAVLEQARSISQLAHEQTMDGYKLLLEHLAIQANPDPAALPPQQIVSSDTPGEKTDDTKAPAKHIVCLVASPPKDKNPTFHEEILLVLRRALELEDFCWQVVCEDERIYKAQEQSNFLTWLKHADAYIVDISTACSRIMIELGAMLDAKKPDQPLIVLLDGSKENDFNDLSDMITIDIKYSHINSDNIKKIASQLHDEFRKRDDMKKLNAKKKAHYLSPLFITDLVQIVPQIAQELSKKFKTMEVVRDTNEDEFCHKAVEAGMTSPDFAPPLRNNIIKKLEQLEAEEGKEHD